MICHEQGQALLDHRLAAAILDASSLPYASSLSRGAQALKHPTEWSFLSRKFAFSHMDCAS